METASIRNVVFDVGNVLVRWSPREIARLTFGDNCDIEALFTRLYKNEIWIALNRGEVTIEEAKVTCMQDLGFSQDEVDRFFYYVQETQILIYGSVQLLERIKKAGYNVFALTDNINEIVNYLKARYTFWPFFDGAIVSAEVGCLKPGKEIYNHLLTNYKLQAVESVFLDDVPANVEGARAAGLHAIQFFNARQAEEELKALGLSF